MALVDLNGAWPQWLENIGSYVKDWIEENVGITNIAEVKGGFWGVYNTNTITQNSNKWFYQENEVFIQEDFSCVGISYYPIVDNVTVNGQPVIIERTMEVDGAIAYFWRIDGIDLEEQLL